MVSKKDLAEPNKNYSMTHANSKSQIDYNYGGYVTRPKDFKGPNASWFNSKKSEENATNTSAMLLRQASRMKRAVKRQNR